MIIKYSGKGNRITRRNRTIFSKFASIFTKSVKNQLKVTVDKIITVC